MLKLYKKRINKSIKKLKEYYEAQKFYIKQKLSSLLQIATAFTKVLVFSAFIIITVLASDLLHTKYMEHYIGQNVVLIRNMPDSKIRGLGTGFELQTPNGKVVTVTNAHICELANDSGLLLVHEKKHSNRLIPKRVIEVFQDNDLCIVEGLEGYSGLEVANSISVGEPVWSIGYPLGEALNISRGRVKEFGSVLVPDETVTDMANCNRPDQMIKEIDMLFFSQKVCFRTFAATRTDIITYGGNSGSPMVNMFGNVVGVIFVANLRTNWGAAVILSDLKELLKAY